MNKVSAIILAGGKGKRMGAEKSKQFIEVNGKPLIYYTLKAFEKCTEINEIVLVLPKDEIEYFNNNILNKFKFNISKIVEGGGERYDSVLNALEVLDNADIVLIHDGARPFVSENIILNGIKHAREYGAAAPGVMPKDTIKIKDTNKFSIDTPDRNYLVAVQTPQCFKFDLIYRCHKAIRKEVVNVTDDTMVVEFYDNKVYLYEGDYENIKVTTPEDLILAREFTKKLEL